MSLQVGDLIKVNQRVLFKSYAKEAIDNDIYQIGIEFKPYIEGSIAGYAYLQKDVIEILDIKLEFREELNDVIKVYKVSYKDSIMYILENHIEEYFNKVG